MLYNINRWLKHTGYTTQPLPGFLNWEDDGGYWDINTCSIIEYPQEWRYIKVLDNGDGTGTISCRMVQHENSECLQTALADPDADPEMQEGTENDRDVNLLFNIPESVALNIKEAKKVIAEIQTDNDSPGSDKSVPDDLSGASPAKSETQSGCFIATAAFGTQMEKEVVVLRRFRDNVLLKKASGRLFVKTYYKLSPPVADFIAKRPFARLITRKLLVPLIHVASKM